MKVVHLLHGLPRSGKTTLAREIEKERGAISLNHDEYMTTVFGNNPPADKFDEMSERVNNLIWALTKKLVDRDVEVILDHGFWTRKSRDNARKRVRAMGATPRFYRMICPDSVADARVLKRSKNLRSGVLQIDQNALELFRSQFEPISGDEDFIDVETGSLANQRR